MYQCQSCGRVFFQPRRWREDRGGCFGHPAWEEMRECPLCGGAYRLLENDACAQEAMTKGGNC